MIRVGESGGKGRGVFALRNISCGEIIEAAPVVVVPHGQVTNLAATVLDDYCFLWGDDREDVAILLGLCSLCNHSYAPNARFVLRPTQLAIEFVALRDITEGEEITTNYNGDPASREPVWFSPNP